MDLMPFTTTATDFQRNYKKVIKKAKDLGKPMVVLSNNKPDGVYLDYQAFQDRYEIVDKKQTAKKSDFSEFSGIWSKEDADNFERVIDEEFEQIDAEDWK